MNINRRTMQQEIDYLRVRVANLIVDAERYGRLYRKARREIAKLKRVVKDSFTTRMEGK